MFSREIKQWVYANKNSLTSEKWRDRNGDFTGAHLFLHCDIFSSLWHHVWRWLHISSVSPGNIRQHFLQFTSMAGLPRFTHTFMKVIWFASIWVIWKERNNRVFQNTVTISSVLVEQVKINSFLWLKSKQVDFAYSYHDWWQKSHSLYGSPIVNCFCFGGGYLLQPP